MKTKKCKKISFKESELLKLFDLKNKRIKITKSLLMNYMLITMSLCIFLSFNACAQSKRKSLDESQVEFPDSRAGKCALEFITAFNSNDPQLFVDFQMKYRDQDYWKRGSQEERITEFKDWQKSWGYLKTIRILRGTEDQITFVIKTLPKEYAVVARFQLDGVTDGKIEFNTFTKITPAELVFDASDDDILKMANRAQSISSEIVVNTLTSVALSIDSLYVFAENGKNIADSLLLYLNKGRYDKITTAGYLCDMLNEDLLNLSKDLHLFVEVTNVGMPESMLFEHRNPDEVKKLNYGFAKTEILDNNIGYLKIDMFRGDDDALTVASKEFSKVSNCNALILDLRENVGGTGKMVNYMASLLFKDSTLLTVTYDRESSIINEDYTSPGLSLIKFDSDIPVFILTSKKTSSAAEAFTYALKHLKRATVIGERTAGMAHASEETIINKYFRLLLPIHRTINPITNSDWEGKGVIPHIEVKKEKSLKTALKLAKEKISK